MRFQDLAHCSSLVSQPQPRAQPVPPKVSKRATTRRPPPSDKGTHGSEIVYSSVMAITFRNPHGPPMAPAKKKTGIARQSHVGCSCHGLPGPVKVPRCRVLKRSKQASKQRAYHHHHTALHCTAPSRPRTTAIVRHRPKHAPKFRTPTLPKRQKSSSTFSYLTLKGSNTERGNRNRRRNGRRGK